MTAAETDSDEASTGSNRRRLGIVLLSGGLFLALLATYANHFDNEFHFDDSHVIEQNTYLRSLGNIPDFFTDADSLSALPSNRTYRPVLLTTFAIDYQVGDGLDPVVFHVTGFLILVAIAVLLVFLFRRLFDLVRPHPANVSVAILGAGWYALHTANAETINYISARSDSLSTLFVVAALVVWMYATGWQRHLAYGFIVLGLLTKANALAVVPIMLAYELFFVDGIGLRSMFSRSNWSAVGQSVLRVVPAALVTVGTLALAWIMTPDTFDAGGPSAWSYLITQPFVVLRYAATFFVPVGLSADTDWTVLDSIADPRFLFGIAFVVGAITLAVVTSERRDTRPIALGILWFFLALAWTSSIIPRAEVTNDHRMFFPFIGLTLAVSWALALVVFRYEAKVRGSGRIAAALGLALVFLFTAHGVGTFQRNQVWDNDESLWEDVTVASPLNGRGLMNYGLSQMARGRYEVALNYFERARLTEYGEHPYVYVNLAIANNAAGNAAAVESLFLTGIERGPGFPETHYHYARWLVDEGRIDEALTRVDTALTLSAGHEPSLLLLGEIQALSSQPMLAAERAAAEDPSAANLIDLSLRYYEVERFDEALLAASQAVAVDPLNPLAHNNVCAVYNAQGQFDLAIVACRTALELDPGYELARANLDWALSQLDPGG